ncbi:MAG: tetratricopeptide repeat-containing sensor histidine kinase [Patiriisocius sp.]|uniref:tetratricopeptide repeat-containing sensor histidine kinase n=1 Tax=Patiriisocius sp. TaxID=2822396 RepID=UPI003EF34A65
MNIRILIFLIALLSFQLAICQDIEHYQYVLATTNDLDKKLESLDSLLSKTFEKDDEKFIKYSLEYIDLAKESDLFEDAAKKAINLQFPLTTSGKDPFKAATVLTSILANKYKIKDSFLLGSLYYRKGKAYHGVSFEDAVENYALAIENFAEKDILHKADAYLYKGHANSNLGNFIQAGSDYNKAYNLYEASGDIQYMLYARQGNITMLSKNGFYEDAEKERKKFINEVLKLNRPEDLTVAYYNQALDYKHTGKYDLELEYLELAEQNVKDLKDADFMIFISALLCEYYIRENNLKKAIENYEIMTAISFDKTSEFDKALVFNGASARYFEKMGEYEKALQAGLEKLKLAKMFGHNEEIIDAHQLLADIYTKLGNFEKALFNKDEYINLKEKTFSKTNLNSLARYQTLYETEKKEKELVEKTANIERLQAQNSEFKKQSIYLSVAGVLLFGIILLYRAQRHHKTNKILQERFSQDLLISQEEERKRISSDLHDGLGQRLLVLKNKLIAKGDLESQKMVDTTIEEVRTITRDLHPFQLQELGITKAIEHTISEIDENTTLFISSEIDNIDNVFSKEQEVNIYRIVQEGLSNVVKHAKAEATKLTVKKAANSVIIAIRDNGDGFDFPEKYNDTKSLGLKTLLERTKFLNGQMKVQSKKENGTLLEFQFPI